MSGDRQHRLVFNIEKAPNVAPLVTIYTIVQFPRSLTAIRKSEAINLKRPRGPIPGELAKMTKLVLHTILINQNIKHKNHSVNSVSLADRIPH